MLRPCQAQEKRRRIVGVRRAFVRSCQTLEGRVETCGRSWKQEQEHRISINVSFQIADESQTNHDESSCQNQIYRRLQISWNTVVGTRIHHDTCSGHQANFIGAYGKGCKREHENETGACRTTTDEASSKAGLISWTSRVLIGEQLWCQATYF